MTHHEVDGAADFLGLHLVSFHAVPAEGKKVSILQSSWTCSQIINHMCSVVITCEIASVVKWKWSITL